MSVDTALAGGSASACQAHDSDCDYDTEHLTETDVNFSELFAIDDHEKSDNEAFETGQSSIRLIRANSIEDESEYPPLPSPPLSSGTTLHHQLIVLIMMIICETVFFLYTARQQVATSNSSAGMV